MNVIMSKIYLELLDKERQKIFLTLSAFKKIGYLAGGTALSLQINHRTSFDFDIFVGRPINNLLRSSVKNVFDIVEYLVNSSDQITFVTSEHIEITFLWYCYQHINPLIKTSSISLASVNDIAVDKAATLGRRAMWRDYIDLFYLLKKNYITLPKIINLAKKKFGVEFVETQFLEQLSYFEDMKIVNIAFMKESYTPEQIKSFLTQKVEKYMKRVVG